MNYWWVSQNQTYKHEVPGGYLWSPKTDKNGRTIEYYENMRRIVPGDIVYSFCDTYIKALGIALSGAQSATKPDFGTVGDEWSDDGWLVPVQFVEFEDPIRPRDHIDTLRPLLPDKYSPLKADGNGNQIYLASIPPAMAQALNTAMGPQYVERLNQLMGSIDSEAANDQHEETIRQRTSVGPTQQAQLVKARRGQGVFNITYG